MNPISPEMFEQFLALQGDPAAQQAFLNSQGLSGNPTQLAQFRIQFQQYIIQTRNTGTPPIPSGPRSFGAGGIMTSAGGGVETDDTAEGTNLQGGGNVNTGRSSGTSGNTGGGTAGGSLVSGPGETGRLGGGEGNGASGPGSGINTPCPRPFVRNASGQCACPTGTTYNGISNTCDGAPAPCPAGTTRQGNICLPDSNFFEISQCPSTFVRGADGTCVCPSGTTYNGISGRCEAPAPCPTGYIRQGGVCLPDTSLTGPVNVSCPETFVFIPGRGCECSSGTTYNGVSNKCVAPAPCPTGYVRQGNVCLPSEPLVTLVCARGEEILNGVCVPVCDKTETRVKGPDGKYFCQDNKPQPATCPTGYEGFKVPNLKNLPILCCPQGIGITLVQTVSGEFIYDCNSSERKDKLKGVIELGLTPKFAPALPVGSSISPTMFINGSTTYTVTTPGIYIATFSSVPSYNTPPPQEINITETDLINAAQATSYATSATVNNRGRVEFYPVLATWTKQELNTPRNTTFVFNHVFGPAEGPFTGRNLGRGIVGNSNIGVGNYSYVAKPNTQFVISFGPVSGYSLPSPLKLSAADEGFGTDPVIKTYEIRYIAEDDGGGESVTCPTGYELVNGSCVEVGPECPPGLVLINGRCTDLNPPPPPTPSGRIIITTEYKPGLPGVGAGKIKEGLIYIDGAEKGRGTYSMAVKEPGTYLIRFGDLEHHPSIQYTTPAFVEVTITPEMYRNSKTVRVVGKYYGRYVFEYRWLHPIATSDTQKINLSFTKGMFSDGIPNLLTYFTSSISDSLDNHYTHVYHKHPDSPTSEIQFSVTYGHKFGSGSNDQGGQYNDTPTRAIYGQYRNIILRNPTGSFNLTGTETDHFYAISYQKDRRDTRADYRALEINIAHLSGSQYINGIGEMSTHTGSNVELGGEGKVLRLISDSKINLEPELGYGGYEYNIVSGTIEDGVYSPNTPHYYGKLYPSLGVVLLDANKLDVSASFGTVTTRETDGKNQLKLFTAISGAALFYDNTGQDYLGMKARATKEEIVNYYFINVRNKEANFTNNPTFFDPVTGEIYNGEYKETRPKVHITTIGLYDENRNLLAVAKTSKPEVKSFTDEVIYNVRLKI